MKRLSVFLIAGACLAASAGWLIAQSGPGEGKKQGPGAMQGRFGGGQQGQCPQQAAGGQGQRQGPGAMQGRAGGGGQGQRMLGPLMAALDANQDGELSAEEIAGAAQALKKLDKNGDGKITRDELRPARAPGGEGAAARPGERAARGQAEQGAGGPARGEGAKWQGRRGDQKGPQPQE